MDYKTYTEEEIEEERKSREKLKKQMNNPKKVLLTFIISLAICALIGVSFAVSNVPCAWIFALSLWLAFIFVRYSKRILSAIGKVVSVSLRIFLWALLSGTVLLIIYCLIKYLPEILRGK